MVDFQNLDLLINEEIQNACLLIFRPIENQLAETYMHQDNLGFSCTQVLNEMTGLFSKGSVSKDTLGIHTSIKLMFRYSL